MKILQEISDVGYLDDFKSKGYVGFIYVTHDTQYDKFYIGKCERENKNYRGSGVIIRTKIASERLSNGNKAVLDRFKCYYICYCKTLDELYNLEKFYILKYNATISEEFYNILDGGICGSNYIKKLNEEELEKYKVEQSNRLKLFWENITPEKYNQLCKSISDRRKNLNTLSKESRKFKMQEVYKSGKHNELFKRYSTERVGGGNPAAIEVFIEGKKYNSMKDAAAELGLKYHIVVRRINSKSSKWENWIRI